MLAFPCGDCRDSEAEAERNGQRVRRVCLHTHLTTAATASHAARVYGKGELIMEENFKVIDNYLMVKMPEEVDHHKSVFISRAADEYIMKEGVGNVVFDFEDTRFMDSSGIGIIIGRYKKISYFGGKVFAINTDARIKRTMMICGLHKVIEIME